MLRYWTDLRNWVSNKKDQEVKQLLETKQNKSAKKCHTIGNDFRELAGIALLKNNKFIVVSVEDTLKHLNSATCDLDAALTQERADFKNAVIGFFEAEKDYQEIICIPNASRKANNEKQEVTFINPKK